MADPDLELSGVGGGGGGGLDLLALSAIFLLFLPKIRGGPGARAPSLDPPLQVSVNVSW